MVKELKKYRKFQSQYLDENSAWQDGILITTTTKEEAALIAGAMYEKCKVEEVVKQEENK